ncbi:TMV resistance protein N-like [Pyrus ussuriensis x Pyrus communis]|uniref:TMV resistance protein N-like n=1 Tax=Pyrus ussuriensis x Pyrus communis TaxID=2448454 RepID=A0A5N5FHH6_9ROSA|nr:TMV resistance protein N-like [Pyrus ussuriensis x Pyrus communis]
MAASSSAANNHLHEKYDVFLSFRALCRKKIKTYIDDNLERGDEIAPALMEAITKSNLSVIIFSENYAFSTWCLDELVHILRSSTHHMYEISRGHMGLHFLNLKNVSRTILTRTEAYLVDKVVEDILTKLSETMSDDLKGLVGIESRINDIKWLLCNHSLDVLTVGIWGMASCFLANMRKESENRIIITTRDRRILKEKVDKIYEVKGLTREEALQLFHLKAFKNNSPGTDYAELLGMVVDYAEGMPLALKILGSSFLHCKSKEDWEAELNKLKKFPSQKIHNVLRLSYDGLEENEKEIFLDIDAYHVLKNNTKLVNLKVISLSFSKHLTEVPNLSRSLKIEHIDLDGCESLFEIPSYFNILTCSFILIFKCARVSIIFRRCQAIWSFYVYSQQTISHFDIACCRYLQNLPSSSSKLKVSGTCSLHKCSSLGKFLELSRGISCLFSLTTLKLNDCKSLSSLPTSICKLESLEKLDLTGCSKFTHFPEILEPMEHLEFLSLKWKVQRLKSYTRQ